MRYDWDDNRICADHLSREFYEATDERHFSEARRAISWRRTPFDTLINFAELREYDVLEIGVGRGSAAQLLATHAKSYTGIDITDYAVKSTSERMNCSVFVGAGFSGWMRSRWSSRKAVSTTYGVGCYPPFGGQILSEMRRVRRPRGVAMTMVYHRGWHYYVRNGLVRGIIRGELLRTKSLHRIAQTHIDGAIARYYSIAEWRRLASRCFDVKGVQIFGSKHEVNVAPGRTLKRLVMGVFPDSASRVLTHTCRLGALLVSRLERN